MAFCPGWAHIRFLPTPCASAYVSLARPPFSVSAPSLPPLSPSIAIQFHFPSEVSVQMGRLGSVQANRRRPMLKEHLVWYAIQAFPTSLEITSKSIWSATPLGYPKPVLFLKIKLYFLYQSASSAFLQDPSVPPPYKSPLSQSPGRTGKTG